MKQYTTTLACLALAACLVLGAAGCATHGRAAGAGAAIGAIAGGIIGNQSGNAAEGAAIGAALGAATGAISHDVKARRQKTREQTVAEYQYQPAQGMELHFEEANVLPSVTSAGKLLEASVQYALLGAQNGVNVVESRKLLRGDRLVAELSEKTFTRADGTWISTSQFRVPGNLQPGVYTLMQRVRAGTLQISGASQFTVQ